MDLQPSSSMQSEIREPSPLPIHPEQPQAQELSATGRPVQEKCLTWKLLQQLPAAPICLPQQAPAANPTSTDVPSPFILESAWKAVYTKYDLFGLYWEYPSMPTHIPDNISHLMELEDISPTAKMQAMTSPPPSAPQTDNMLAESSHFLFKNLTTFGLMDWMWTGSAKKSIAEIKKLLDFLKSDNFRKEDLLGFDIQVETAKFDQYLDGPSNSGTTSEAQLPSAVRGDGWCKSDIHIQVPDLQCHSPNDIPTFTIPSLFHQSLVEVVKLTLSDVASKSFHYTPFKSFWQLNSQQSESLETQRVYD